MRVSVCGYTEKGPRHEANEDVILVGHTICTSGEVEAHMNGEPGGLSEKGALVAVADGMGSNAVGAEAARLTLETLKAYFHAEPKGADLRSLANSFYSIAHRVNSVVLEYGERQNEYAGMACTLTGVVLFGGEYVAFNAGDSRVYRFSRGVLRQITEDHSEVAEAVRMGEMTLVDARTSQFKHFVTNAMGSDSFQLQLGDCQALDPGDALLICSDGLHNVLHLDRMERMLSEYGSARDRCKALMWAAAESGDYDDVSVIIVNAEE